MCKLFGLCFYVYNKNLLLNKPFHLKYVIIFAIAPLKKANKQKNQGKHKNEKNISFIGFIFNIY